MNERLQRLIDRIHPDDLAILRGIARAERQDKGIRNLRGLVADLIDAVCDLAEEQHDDTLMAR